MTDIRYAPNLNVLWADLLIEQLVRCGCDFCCLSSGSRSAPLVAAVAGQKKLRSVVHFDERGAAYQALGYARATGRAALCITTSGTAVANAWPAVVEAARSHTPLILLSADRPPELRDTGANQTIDQVNLFGKYLNWFFDLPCPTVSIAPEMVLSTAGQAWFRAHRRPAGPVHLNCMFREPLAPDSDGQDYSGYLAGLSDWLSGREPYGVHHVARAMPDPDMLKSVFSRLAATQRGLVIVGHLRDEGEAHAVASLVEALQWPTLADVTSGLRLGAVSGALIAPGDVLAGHRRFAAGHHPDTVLHLGGALVSKRILEFVRASRPQHYLQVKGDPDRQDPQHLVTHHVECDLSEFCRAVTGAGRSPPPSDWLSGWQRAADMAQTKIDELSAAHGELSEPSVARLLSKMLPGRSGLVLANSMPVRDMDVFADSHGPSVQVLANRGASGIDGTVATAAGYSQGLRQPVTVLIGDLALLHDLNSLSLVRSSDYPVIVVVLNNNGGGIFHFLPVANHAAIFEPFFGTPHHLTFEPAARLFGLDYQAPSDLDGFGQSYRRALKSGKSALIEVASDRQRNLRLHQEWLQQISAAIDEVA